jgi:Alpha-glutamyl/putrescinyl thymine pyrophosphorylase clade 3
MRPKDKGLAYEIDLKLQEYSLTRRLPGIENPLYRYTLLEQILESIHRIKYVSLLLHRPISRLRANPQSDLFDPLKASIFWMRKGQLDEAFWLVFIFVHFGKHKSLGWKTARDIYGRLGNANHWNWMNISASPHNFRVWLEANKNSIPWGFGNHRKYQSLSAWSATGTGSAVESYIEWVCKFGNHQNLIENALANTGNDSRLAFDYLYQSMKDVSSFGRTAKFDYLTMIAKLQFAPIEAGSAYLQGATGPYAGAQLLFGGYTNTNLSRINLDKWLIDLESQLGVGMQVLEDSLCNWQKSPEHFIPFRG